MAWIMQNGQLTNTDSIGLPEKPFQGDSPFSFWRITPRVNDNLPYTPFMIGIPELETNVYLGNRPTVNMYYGYRPVTAIHYGLR